MKARTLGATACLALLLTAMASGPGGQKGFKWRRRELDFAVMTVIITVY